jgi:xanthine permease XanP
MDSIRGGILGDGIAAAVAGLLGSYGLTISTVNVGLVAATGVASRQIAFWISALLALVAIQPSLIGTLTIMPQPVMAAAMLFTAVFIMISGIQIISSRILDARRTLVIGMGMMAFVAVSVFPTAFGAAPQWAQPLVSSPLVLATLVALCLNLIFRLGIRRVVVLSTEPPAADHQRIHNFIERNAAIWGARRDVVNRVEFTVQQAVETISEHCQVEGPIEIKIGYDEFDIDVSLTYIGALLELPDKLPTQDEILESEDGARRLAGYLIKRQSDKIQTSSNDGRAAVRLHFKH